MSHTLDNTGDVQFGKVAVEPEKENSTGRPSDYSPDFLQAAKDYLVTYEAKGDVVPTIEGLADELKKAVKTLYNWAEAHDEFQDVLGQLLAKQGRLLQSKGLKKETDSGITKLLLSANHGKAEKSESKQDLTSGGEKIDGFVIRFVNEPPRS
jgi:hypothetical protein